MTDFQITYETLNLPAISSRMNIYQKPVTYSVNRHMGSGCFGDPPGYPSYYLRSVYTQFGNEPRKGTSQVLQVEDKLYAVPSLWKPGAREAFLNKLYLPLPEDHPRVQAWEQWVYTHFAHCYGHPGKTMDAANLIIWPIREHTFISLGMFAREIDWREIPEIGDEQVKLIMASREAAVKAERESYRTSLRPFITIDNYRPVTYIRQWYPDHKPRLDWVAKAPGLSGDWWERHTSVPDPEECPGPLQDNRTHKNILLRTPPPERKKGIRCQFCGRWYDHTIGDWVFLSEGD